MANYVVVEEKVETQTERRIRIFIAVLYFIQVLMIPLPLMQGDIEGGIGHRTALNLLFQYNGFNSFGEVVVAIYGAILIIMPIVTFFFFILDKRSKKKYFVSIITCFACAFIICFGTGDTIAIGGVLTLILEILILFMTSLGFQATRIRERQSSN